MPVSMSLLTQVSRSSATYRAVPILRRSFVLLASRRSAFPHPRRLFPSELLAPRLSSFSTSSQILAATALAESERYSSSETEPEPAHVIADSRVEFATLQDKIHHNTLKAITVKPFKHTHMSPVQEQILPMLPDLAHPHNPDLPHDPKKPRDLLVKAKTGTGKTMAFLIPAIESRLKAVDAHAEETLRKLVETGVDNPTEMDRKKAEVDYARKTVGTIIISPTRELATQIAVEAQNLTAHHPGFQIQLFLGGESKVKQLRAWSGRKDIVVATPGRLIDLCETRIEVMEFMKTAKMLILDEADTLLDMGFRDDIERVIRYLPPSPQRQTFLFSATVSPAIEQIAHKTLSRSHSFVNCVSADDSPVHDHIPQYHTVIPSGDQAFPHLLRLIAHDQLIKAQEGANSKIAVFFSTTKMVQLFAELLRMCAHALPHGRAGTRIYEMHAKRDMDRRIATSKSFRHDTNLGSILVTSDVSARGVDYPGVTRVIQMGLPASKDMYIHRVGRTGRAGKTDGRGDLVLSSWEVDFLQRKMREVNMQPLTVSELVSQVEEAAKELAVTEPKKSSYLPHLTSLTELATSSTSGIPPETISDTYLSQLGFYIGHIDHLALRQQDVVDGVTRFFQDLGGMASPPTLSRLMQERLKIGVSGFGDKRRGGRNGFGNYGGGGRDAGSGAGYGQSQRKPAWGTYATGSDGRGLGRNEQQRSPWESRSSAGAGGFRNNRDSSEGGYGRRNDRGSSTSSRSEGFSSRGSRNSYGFGASGTSTGTGYKGSTYGTGAVRSPGFERRGAVKKRTMDFKDF